MNIRKNRIKEIFNSGQFSIGLWNGIADTYAAEICAGAGFDWVLIDAEHAPFSNREILHQLQAMSGFDTGVVVRPPSGNSVLLKQLLDIGVQNFLVPMVETKEQAEQIVRSLQYPPKGIRGVGSALARAAQWKRVEGYFDKADDNLCLIVQIESVKGLENLEAICSVDGIDGVFIGPADLAGSMGYLGQPMHEDVRKEVRNALRLIKSSGKVAGTLAVKKEVAEEYKNAGASFMGLGVDLVLLAKATQQLAADYKFLKF